LSDEQPCPGFASGKCATCDCPWYTPPPPIECKCSPPGTHFPAVYAPKGAAAFGVYGGGCHVGMDTRGVMPWEEIHPDDMRELERERAAREAKRMIQQATGERTGKGYVLAALRGEAQNIIDAARTNNQINISTFKLRKKYVDSGDLTIDEVAQTIYDAAFERGYERQIVGTIASALGISTGEVRRLVNL
jgi:hypothetical protein